MNIKADVATLLKKSPQQSSESSPEQLKEVPAGQEYAVVSYEEAEGGHYKVELDFGAGIWYIWSGHWRLSWEDGEESDDEPMRMFTEADLKTIMPQASSADIRTYVEPINKTLYDFDLDTKTRAAAFIAQVAHESGSLKYKEEIADGSAYEGRLDLGNIKPGDGRRYKGRGLIQLTGRANYRQAGEAMKLPLEDQPELVVRDPYINAAIAGWYWQSRNINAVAERGDFAAVTRRINGGLNGQSDRLEFWERAKKVLNAENNSVQAIPETWQQVNWNDFNASVSKYFTVREVTNGDPRRIPQDDAIKANIVSLAQELDRVREAWGSPILVTSWYRPRAINQAVGGAENSQHILGIAADIHPAKGNLPQFQEWLDKAAWKDKALGYGARKGFVHVDLRPGPNRLIRWNY
ncbi:MAG: peptidase M15 [Chloroflexaceae bacterium]|nr:peptidase M15 [Chloroflexaceae bacterium]